MKILPEYLPHSFVILFLLLVWTGCSDTIDETKKPATIEYQAFFDKAKSANLDVLRSLDLSESVSFNLNEGTIHFSTAILDEKFQEIYAVQGLHFDPEILKSIDFTDPSELQTGSEIIPKIEGIDDHFGETFYHYFSKFNDHVLAHVDNLNQTVIEGFAEEVKQSERLSHDEKLMLSSYLSALSGTLSFIDHGGVEQIESQIKELLISQDPAMAARLLRCRVNIRNVLLGGIYGLATNAVRGAIVGGTVGTFAVPVLGSATGAVGGAVFGAAAGFLGGIIGGVVVELAATCTRSSTYHEARCERTLSLYHAGLIRSYPTCKQYDASDFQINSSGPRSLGNFFSSNLNYL